MIFVCKVAPKHADAINANLYFRYLISFVPNSLCKLTHFIPNFSAVNKCIHQDVLKECEVT